MNKVYIISAKRTPVAPRSGALRRYPVIELGARAIAATLLASGLPAEAVEAVVMGNALYAGGNPARLAALAAGIPESAAGMTIDTQCCAGLDAINTACSMVRAGAAELVVAGGLESYSRAPLRLARPLHLGDRPVSYQRPPFTPWPERDPDMLCAAAELAAQRGIGRRDQEVYAIASHYRARCGGANCDELVAFDELSHDSFTRVLNAKLCARAPLVAGDANTGLTSTTVAVEADAAASVLVAGEAVLSDVARPVRAQVLRVVDGIAVGIDPSVPALAPVAAVQRVLARQMLLPESIAVVEMMEAFAVQAMVGIEACGFAKAAVNRGGGALARGHPIGASGAILAVRLWHELQREPSDSYGLAAIAAAGGLGSAALWQKVKKC